jgi:hypothetical protein
MHASEQTDQLAAALALAQGEMKNATLNKSNPHFKSRYADLAAVRDASVPALAKHGLALTQTTEFDDAGRFILVTRLAHKSGQWERSVYPLPLCVDKPQAMGSALTYARRYAWAAMVGISADEDDDANEAQDEGARNPKGSKTPEPAPSEKALADKIKASIDAAKSLAALNAVMKGYGEVPPDVEMDADCALAKVKAFSATAYDFLVNRANDRRAKFSAPPEQMAAE